MKYLKQIEKDYFTYKNLSLLYFREIITDMIEYYIDEIDEWHYQRYDDILPIPLKQLTDIPEGVVKVGFIIYDYFVGLAYRYDECDVQIYNHHKTTANIATKKNEGWSISDYATSYIELTKEINIKKLIDRI